MGSTSVSRALIAVALTASFCFGVAQPARADGAAVTRNAIIGGALIVTGIVIGKNVAHKKELAHTVVGNTPDGATVFADGRVAYPGGYSYYPNDDGHQIACRDLRCDVFRDSTPP